ncbi:FMN reductase (NADPH), partial [Streptomyces sp. SID8380]|nr:FMN reductase (NADPH) [Streptomyces sp. SID8380]
AAHVVPGWFVVDKDLTVDPDGTLTLPAATDEALTQVTDAFARALHTAFPAPVPVPVPVG